MPCSPIFQSLCPTNRLCSPPSSSCILYLHIAPKTRSHRLHKPQLSSCSVRLRAVLPTGLFFVLPRYAPLVTYHHCMPRVLWSEPHTHDQVSASGALRLSRSNTISVSALPGSYPHLRRTIVSSLLVPNLSIALAIHHGRGRLTALSFLPFLF